MGQSDNNRKVQVSDSLVKTENLAIYSAKIYICFHTPLIFGTFHGDKLQIKTGILWLCHWYTSRYHEKSIPTYSILRWNHRKQMLSKRNYACHIDLYC